LGHEWDDIKVWGYSIALYALLSSGVFHWNWKKPSVLTHSSHSLLSSSNSPQSPSWPSGCSSWYVWFPALEKPADYHDFTSEHRSSSPRYFVPLYSMLSAATHFYPSTTSSSPCSLPQPYIIRRYTSL
jgi:hypothetical protein